jgi:ADP-ribose pyrophosphatase
MKLTEKLFKKQCVYKGKAVDMHNDIVILPNNEKATREYLGHPGAVAVVPFINKTDIVFVRQFRYPVNEITYEIPAGKLDKNEKLLKCVNREQEEETGFKAKKLKNFFSFWPTPAFSNEVLHIFKAVDLAKGTINPDEDEFINTVIIPYKKAIEMIKNGKIKDSKTIIALTYLSVL